MFARKSRSFVGGGHEVLREKNFRPSKGKGVAVSGSIIRGALHMLILSKIRYITGNLSNYKVSDRLLSLFGTENEKMEEECVGKHRK